MLRSHGIFDYKIGAPAGPPSGYIGLWKFENNVNDDTGTYSATAYGSPTYDTGKVGSYCLVTASGKYVTTNLLRSVFENNNCSVAGWYNFTTGTRGKCWMASNAGGGFGLGVNDSANSGKFNADIPSSTYAYVQTSSSYRDGNWHFVVVKFDISTKTVTINVDNGAEVVSSTGGGTISPRTDPLTFGRHGTYNGVYYDGKQDQVYIYTKLLSDSEISQLWNGGAGI